jgi:hypothetical protein
VTAPWELEIALKHVMEMVDKHKTYTNSYDNDGDALEREAIRYNTLYLEKAGYVVVEIKGEHGYNEGYTITINDGTHKSELLSYIEEIDAAIASKGYFECVTKEELVKFNKYEYKDYFDENYSYEYSDVDDEDFIIKVTKKERS